MENLPKYQDLIQPLLRSLASKPSALPNSEIAALVIHELGLTQEQASQIHSGKRTELEYRLAWARTKAKANGWITSSKRESWELTELGKGQVQIR
jgi:restriction system protein